MQGKDAPLRTGKIVEAARLDKKVFERTIKI